MQIRYTCPYWGQEGISAPAFIQKVLQEGYDGMEINLPEEELFTAELHAELDRTRAERQNGFLFIAQQWLPPACETPAEYLGRLKKKLQFIVSMAPDAINSHTGKDYYSFDDNCRIIEAVMNIAQKSGISVLHETHRGRFSFHAAGLLSYLQRFPEMELVADLSHWCVVSESLLEDQEPILEKIIPHVAYIHARIGFEQGPQVNDPFAPEWENHFSVFMGWWKSIISCRQQSGRKLFTICPEFGPPPYMPVMPFTQQALADQWKINAAVMEQIRRELNINL
jgi:sugar phosphate isomerase/epimerase